MKTLLVILSLLTMPGFAQVDRRWKLLPDSMVLAPIADLRLALGYRRTQDTRVFNAMRELSGKDREIAALKRALVEADTTINRKNQLADLCAENYQRKDEDLEKCNTKLANIKPWATVGKVGTVVAVVYLGFRLVGELTKAP